MVEFFFVENYDLGATMQLTETASVLLAKAEELSPTLILLVEFLVSGISILKGIV